MKTAMRIGISTASYFNRMPIEDAILELGAQGVRICELFLNSFSEYTDEFSSFLAERVHQAGLTVYSVHPMSLQFEPQLFSAHPRQRADAFRMFEQILRSAARLHTTHYVMHGAAYLIGASKGLSMERIAPVFSELTALADSYGVTLTLENVSWGLFRTPQFGEELRSRVGDALRYTLDVKQAVRSGYRPSDYIRAVGPCIENVHLCDFVRTETGCRWKLPLEGEFDFDGLFTELHAAGYRGPAFIEVYSDAYTDTTALYDCYRKLAARFDFEG